MLSSKSCTKLSGDAGGQQLVALCYWLELFETVEEQKEESDPGSQDTPRSRLATAENRWTEH